MTTFPRITRTAKQFTRNDESNYFVRRVDAENRELPDESWNCNCEKAILTALKNGTLYPHQCPRNYGKYTHREVCRWAGVDESMLPPFSN